MASWLTQCHFQFCLWVAVQNSTRVGAIPGFLLGISNRDVPQANLVPKRTPIKPHLPVWHQLRKVPWQYTSTMHSRPDVVYTDMRVMVWAIMTDRKSLLGASSVRIVRIASRRY